MGGRIAPGTIEPCHRVDVPDPPCARCAIAAQCATLRQTCAAWRHYVDTGEVVKHQIRRRIRKMKAGKH
jgi:hypothetical protein